MNNSLWRKLERSAGDVDMYVEIVTKKLADILDKIAPVKKFQIRTKYCAWVGDETKEKMMI